MILFFYLNFCKNGLRTAGVPRQKCHLSTLFFFWRRCQVRKETSWIANLSGNCPKFYHPPHRIWPSFSRNSVFRFPQYNQSSASQNWPSCFLKLGYLRSILGHRIFRTWWSKMGTRNFSTFIHLFIFPKIPHRYPETVYFIRYFKSNKKLYYCKKNWSNFPKSYIVNV